MVDKKVNAIKAKSQTTKKTQKKQGKSNMAEKDAKTVKKTKKETTSKFVKVEEHVEELEKTYQTIGEELKSARLEKKVSLDKISEELNIKVSQLEAIEKGDKEALPEMIYASGFVRNYADYLGIDSKYASDKFKDENSGEPVQAKDFTFPEPLYENSVPGPTILGIGAFLSIVVLIAWLVYSGVDADKSDIGAKENVVASMKKSDNVNMLAGNNKMAEPEFVETAPEPVAEKPRTVAVTKEELIARETDKEEPSVKIVKNKESGERKLRALTPAASNNQIAEIDVKVVETNKPSMEAVEINEEHVKEKVKIERKTAAVMLKAKEASWIQVTDKNQKVIFRKVLRPGDEYVVPNRKGLILVTANAGGLEVYVHGKKVQSIGKPGEIVRGVELDPNQLKLRRIKSRR